MAGGRQREQPPRWSDTSRSSWPHRAGPDQARAWSGHVSADRWGHAPRCRSGDTPRRGSSATPPARARGSGRRTATTLAYQSRCCYVPGWGSFPSPSSPRSLRGPCPGGAGATSEPSRTAGGVDSPPDPDPRGSRASSTTGAVIREEPAAGDGPDGPAMARRAGRSQARSRRCLLGDQAPGCREHSGTVQPRRGSVSRQLPGRGVRPGAAGRGQAGRSPSRCERAIRVLTPL